jgi:hypothetical protein
MFTHLLALLLFAGLLLNCGGGDKHLPSSNPPEYDPNKVYITPAPQSAILPDKPASLRRNVADPCERQPRKPPEREATPTGCSGELKRDDNPIVPHGGAGGGSGGDPGGGGIDRPPAPMAKRLSYLLEFQSRIVSTEPTEPVESVAVGTVVLTPIEGKEGWYRGSGMLGYQTGPPANRDPCTTLVIGHGTTPIDVAGMSIKLSQTTDPTGRQTG